MNCTHKECKDVRKRLKQVESELAALRSRAADPGRELEVRPLPNGDAEFRFLSDGYTVCFVLSENPRNICWNKTDENGHGEGGVLDAEAMKELIRLARLAAANGRES